MDVLGVHQLSLTVVYDVGSTWVCFSVNMVLSTTSGSDRVSSSSWGFSVSISGSRVGGASVVTVAKVGSASGVK